MTKSKHYSNDDLTCLLIMAGKGDRRAFEELYVAFRPAVYNYLVRLDRSVDYHWRWDLTHEVFVRAWGNLANFRNEASAKTYLLSIAKNVLREDQLRRRKNPVTHVADVNYLADAITWNTPVYGTESDYGESFERIERAMAKLTDKQQQALKLVAEDGMTHAKAARLAGCNPDQFANRLCRARKRLRKLTAPGD